MRKYSLKVEETIMKDEHQCQEFADDSTTLAKTTKELGRVKRKNIARIPKALLEKVRQKQAAKALLSMTRSEDKEKELKVYSRLPELARLTRNVFVSEKKNVLQLDILVDKLGNCYRSHLTKLEMEEHLRILSKEFPTWLVFHVVRNCVYVKIAKSDDLSLIINKLESIVKQKSEL
uniref:DNA replication factor Cdt1-like n=1 Tax=Diabrotica virgifera virgifera TaxID=50390 RepID=A0A6P7FEJ9_DIAVI